MKHIKSFQQINEDNEDSDKHIEGFGNFIEKMGNRANHLLKAKQIVVDMFNSGVDHEQKYNVDEDEIFLLKDEKLKNFIINDIFEPNGKLKLAEDYPCDDRFYNDFKDYLEKMTGKRHRTPGVKQLSDDFSKKWKKEHNCKETPDNEKIVEHLPRAWDEDKRIFKFLFFVEEGNEEQYTPFVVDWKNKEVYFSLIGEIKEFMNIKNWQ